MVCNDPVLSISIGFGATCSGSGVYIDENKNLCVNGSKIFPVGLYGVFYDSLLNPHPEMTPEFTFRTIAVSSEWYNQIPASGYTSVVDSFAAYNQYLTPLGSMASSLTEADKNNLTLLAYMLPDEPDLQSQPYPKSPNEIQILYNQTKAADPNHPTLLKTVLKYNGVSSLYAYRNATDIIMYDHYIVGNDPTAFDPTGSWSREDTPYAAEYKDYRNSFLDMTAESINNPIWLVVQAFGQPNGPFDTLTKQEVRTMSFLPITLNLKGIVYWIFAAAEGHPDYGLVSNPTELGYYKVQASEIRSINDILVMPTIAYSWFGKPDYNTVQLSGEGLTKTFIYGPGTSMTVDKLNWILKGDGNKMYLVIMNKDITTISNVTITVPSISNITGQISTMIDDDYAGQPGGRILDITNGSFTDTFNPKSVHVYWLV